MNNKSTDSETPLSVSEITAEIKQLIRNHFDRVTVQGELADFTDYEASGHMYFSLSDGEAKISGVMFSHANRNLDFTPEEGMEVIVEGRLDVYEARGNYQVIVERMTPAGRGKLEREFQQLKEKLEEEGALAAGRKQELPYFPATIGVVTSGDGAAFWDIVHTLRRRCPVVRVVLYPSRVNGREAAGEIASAVRRLPEIADLDCLIVGRGGGSPEDLWGFNEEPVARAILDCPVPVVSAVGHEVDVTISDLVADHRSPTPTAAADEIVPELGELAAKVREQKQKLQAGYRNRVDRGWERLQFMGEKPVFSDPGGWIRPYRDNLVRLAEKLATHYTSYCTEKQNELDQIKNKLESINPQRVLERGYTLVKKGEELVTSSTGTEAGDDLEISWRDGSHQVKVKNG